MPGLDGKRVLIFDIDKINQENLFDTLSVMNALFDPALSVLSAIDLLKNNLYSLIILFVPIKAEEMAGEKDVIELLQFLSDRHSQIPIMIYALDEKARDIMSRFKDGMTIQYPTLRLSIADTGAMIREAVERAESRVTIPDLQKQLSDNVIKTNEVIKAMADMAIVLDTEKKKNEDKTKTVGYNFNELIINTITKSQGAVITLVLAIIGVAIAYFSGLIPK